MYVEREADVEPKRSSLAPCQNKMGFTFSCIQRRSKSSLVELNPPTALTNLESSPYQSHQNEGSSTNNEVFSYTRLELEIILKE